MYSVTALEIRGYRQAPLANTFFLQAEETDELAIVFPGFAYTADMPALFYPIRYLLLERGCDVLRVEYAYDRAPDFATLAPEARASWVREDALAACRAGLAQRPYRRTILAGKSIGTMAMGQALAAEPRLKQAQCIWITGMLTNPQLQQQILEGRQRGLFVIGTADRYYDPQVLDELVAAGNGRSLVIQGADHSLEIGPDVIKSLHVMESFLRALDAFLKAEP